LNGGSWVGGFEMDNIYWVIEWKNENDPKRHSKKLFREAGYTYTDATVYADAVFDASPNLIKLTITVYDGPAVLCKQGVFG
jgi:hypothetical protein